MSSSRESISPTVPYGYEPSARVDWFAWVTSLLQRHGVRRARRAVGTSGVLILARGVSLLSSLVIVPATIKYLSADGYGVWMTLLSLLTMLSLADLGVGNALVSRIAVAVALHDDPAVAKDTSTAFTMFSVIAVMSSIGLLVAYFAVPWFRVFNLAEGSVLAEQAGKAVLILVAVQILRIPLDLVLHLRRGRQEGYVNALLDIPAALLKVVLVLLSVRVGCPLYLVVLAASVSPLIVNALNWILLVSSHREYLPRRAFFDSGRARELLQNGGLFLALQVAVLIGYSSDNLVAAQLLGPAAVSQYAVPSQLALMGMGFISLLSAPLWGAYAEANARRDYSWVRSTLQKSMCISLAFAFVFAAGLVAVGRQVVSHWSRGSVRPTLLLMLGLAAWVVLGSAGAALSVFLNAMKVVRLQVICSMLMAVSNILLSITLVGHVGVAGLVWGTTISYSVFIVLPYSVLVPRYLRSLR